MPYSNIKGPFSKYQLFRVIKNPYGLITGYAFFILLLIAGFLWINPKNEPDPLADYHTGIVALASWPWALLGAALAIGFLTVSILDGLKPKFRIVLSQGWVNDWLDDGSDWNFIWWRFLESRAERNKITRERNNNSDDLSNQSAPLNTRAKPDKQEAQRQLEFLATSGDNKALYKLPIANMCGQIVVALQVAVESPEIYYDLLFGLLINNTKDYSTLLDLETIRALDQSATVNDKDSVTYFEAKARIGAFIQRKVDTLQINSEEKWRRFTWFLTLLLSFTISFLGIGLIAGSLVLNVWTRLFVVGLLTYEGAYLGKILGSAMSYFSKKLL